MFSSAPEKTSFVFSAKRRSPASISFTICASAPFCGPKMALAPFSPQSGLFTSHATRKAHAASSGRAAADEMCSRANSPAAPPGIGLPSASVRSKPSACSMPAPPSLVALPPMPIKNLLHPRSSASPITCPTPKVVVCSGLRFSFGTSGSPAAPAISITARSPMTP